MSFNRILAKIVIPQALRSSVLPMTNLFIAVMLTSALAMRDALYEAPGPKMRAKIRIGTATSLVAVAARPGRSRPGTRSLQS